MSASLRKRHSFCETWPVGQGQALNRIVVSLMDAWPFSSRQVKPSETRKAQNSPVASAVQRGRTPKHQTVSLGPLVERILGAIVYEGIFCEELVVLIHIFFFELCCAHHHDSGSHWSVKIIVMVRQRCQKKGPGQRSRNNTKPNKTPPNKQQTTKPVPDRSWWKGETSSGSHGYLHIPGSHFVFRM